MLKVLVRDREGVKFNGGAVAVSSVNAAGPFDVLPGHTNFISLIRKRVSVTGPEGKKTEFNLESGVIQVLKDQVNVYLGVEM